MWKYNGKQGGLSLSHFCANLKFDFLRTVPQGTLMLDAPRSCPESDKLNFVRFRGSYSLVVCLGHMWLYLSRRLERNECGIDLPIYMHTSMQSEVLYICMVILSSTIPNALFA